MTNYTDDLYFVYGTLKRGYGNHRVLGDAQFEAEVVTIDDFYLTDCGFPYLIPQIVPESPVEAHTAPVRGELYHIPLEEDRASVDALEGVGYGHYEHREIQVRDEEGNVRWATAYVPCEPEMCLQFPSCQIVNGALEWM